MARAPASPPPQRPLQPVVKEFTFGPGPLGLVLQDKDGIISIAQVDGQAAKQGVAPLSAIVGLNGEVLHGINRAGLVARIQQCSRPLKLHIQLPPSAAPQPRWTADSPPPPPRSMQVVRVEASKFAQQLRELREMGFVDEVAAVRALESVGGEVGEAAMQLAQ